MNSGFNFLDSLEITLSKNSTFIFNSIKSQLDQGLIINEFIVDYLPRGIKEHVYSFLEFTTFVKAIELSLQLYEYDKMTKQQFIKSLLRPLILFVVSLGAVQLFIVLCLPVLLALMRDFEVNDFTLRTGGTIFTLFINSVLIVLVVLLVIVFYFIRPKNKVLGYVLLSKTYFYKTVRHFVSGQFAAYFHACVKSGYTTQTILLILQKMKQKPLLVFNAYHIEQALLKGEKIEDAINNRYLDTTLQKYIQIAVYSTGLKNMLEGYIEYNTQVGYNLCKRWAKRITLISYSSIALMLVLIYQVLLLPLSIIQEMG